MIFQGPLIFVVAMCRTRVAFLFKRYFCQVICSLFFYQVFCLSFFLSLFSFFCQVVFSLFFCQVVFSFFQPGGDLTPLHNKPFQDSCCLPCCRGGGEFIELPAEELSTIDRSLFHILVCILCVFVFVYLFPHMSKSLLNRRRT